MSIRGSKIYRIFLLIILIQVIITKSLHLFGQDKSLNYDIIIPSASKISEILKDKTKTVVEKNNRIDSLILTSTDQRFISEQIEYLYRKIDYNIGVRNFEDHVFEGADDLVVLLSKTNNVFSHLSVNALYASIKSIETQDSLFIEYSTRYLNILEDLKQQPHHPLWQNSSFVNRVVETLHLQLFYGMMIADQDFISKVNAECEEILKISTNEQKALILRSQFVYYYGLKDYYKALAAIDKSIDYCSGTCDIISLHINLSIIFLEIEDFSKAAGQLELAIQHEQFTSRSLNNKIRAYHLISRAYIGLNKLDSARITIDKATPLLDSTNNSFYYNNEHNYVEGLWNEATGNIQRAINYYQSTYQAKFQSFDTYWVSGSLTKLINYNHLTDINYETEANYLYLIDSTVNITEYQYSIDALEGITKLYRDAGYEDLALKYESKIKEKRDAQLDVMFDIYKYESDKLKSLEDNSSPDELSARSIFPAIIVAIILICLIAILFYFVRKARKLEAEKTNLANSNQIFLERVDELRDEMSNIEFFANQISHDLRSPLRRVNEINQLLSQKLDKEEIQSLNEESNNIKDEVNRLTQYLDNFLHVSTGKSSKREVISLKSIIQTIDAIVDKSNIHSIDYKIEEDIFLHMSKFDITTVFKNLIENAIQHASLPNLVIEISKTSFDQQLYLRIKNEIGHKKSDTNLLPNYGLGMRLCEIILDKYGEHIKVDDAHKNIYSLSLSINNVIC